MWDFVIVFELECLSQVTMVITGHTWIASEVVPFSLRVFGVSRKRVNGVSDLIAINEPTRLEV